VRPETPGNQAPWYDTAVPESAQYLGFLPLSVDGVDDSPYTRSTTNAVGGGGVFGASQVLPRTMTVSGVIVGSTCCGAAYGLHYLTEVLNATFSTTNDACDACAGDRLFMYNCCPDPGMSATAFNIAHKRTFRRTALVSGPTVTRRTGTGSCATSSCASGAELIEVEFVLVAAVPWAYTEQTPALNVFLPIGGQPAQACVTWCLTSTGTTCGGSVCLHQDCDTAVICQDPLNPIMQPPEPDVPNSNFCVPLVRERDLYLLDLSGRPAWAEDVPTVTVSNPGPGALRNVRVTFYAKPDASPCSVTYVDSQLCQPVDDFVFTFVPAGGSVTVDGQTGTASVQCGGPCAPATTVYSTSEGNPLKVNGLTGDYYCVSIETDSANPPPAGSTVTIDLSGRGY
jgi:hypothetical protein